MAVRACGAEFRCHARYLRIFGLWLGFLSLWDVVGGADLAMRDCGAGFRCHACNLRLGGLLGGADLAMHDCGARFRCHTCNLRLGGLLGGPTWSRMTVVPDFGATHATSILQVILGSLVDMACL